jgi:tRNA(fMet)-specific endonuclease VapC
MLLRSIVALPLGESAVPHCAAVRSTLRHQGTPIGRNDTWIAAHALAEGLIQVTGNEREFARVPGLKVENWLR